MKEAGRMNWEGAKKLEKNCKETDRTEDDLMVNNREGTHV